MMSKLIFVATLATLASAWTDFHALNPHHKTTELADERLHLSHDVHHTFAEHGTYFKAKYEAIHHKKWHFVALDEHDVDFMKHVECGASDQELFVKHPSAKLTAALAKQNFESTVLTAHHQHHCSETAIFRGVTGATYHQETDTLQIHTTQMRYEHVFEHLDLKLETDHFEGEVEDLSNAEESDAELQLPQPEEETAVETAGRNMQAQGWFKKAAKRIKKAVKKVIAKGKKVVTKVVTAVKQEWRSVSKLVTGDYTMNKTWTLKSLNFNKDVTKKFSKWNFNGDVRLAASANANKPTLVFNLKIASFKVTLSEVYLNVAYQGGIRVQFGATGAYNNKQDKKLSLINLNSVTFKVAGISVVISVTCPINAGFDIDVDGRVRFNFLLAASGALKLGARYTPTRGFQVINSVSLVKTRDFSPRYYRYQVGLQAFVTIQFKASVNFLGFMAAAMSLSTEATLQSNSRCIMLLQMNFQPIITAQYDIKLSLAGKTLVKKSFGPKALVSWKRTVINYCIPKKRDAASLSKYCSKSWRRNYSKCRTARSRIGAHGMTIQGASGETEPVDDEPVVITKPDEIEDNSTGTTWFGESDCTGSGSSLKKTLTFSMQFLAGDFVNSSNDRESTQIILTLAHNESLSGDQGDYRLTNMQRTYAMNFSIEAGFDGVMMLHNEADPEAQYNASDNDTADRVLIDSSFKIKVDQDDATKISVSASNMFCSTKFLKLAAAQYNDDNTTFTVFASGESGEEEKSILHTLKAYVIIVPILCCVMLVIIVVVVCMQKKKAQAAHGAQWAKSQSQHDVEPIMGQEPAAGQVQNSVAPAPSPTQDSRVAAL